MKWNRPDDTLNFRTARALSGMGFGENLAEGLYICQGRDYGGNTVDRITVTDDGLGATGFYTRVIAWSDMKPVWEGPLHNLEGVDYVQGDI